MTTVYRGVIKERILYPESIVITTTNLDEIDFDKVIYCEVSAEGAMGHEGGIILYVLKDENSIVTYETNAFLDKQMYETTSEKIRQNIDLLDSYDGSYGNYVYVKSNANLEIDEEYECFWYHSKKTKLRIDSSVRGVFLSVIAEMTA